MEWYTISATRLYSRSATNWRLYSIEGVLYASEGVRTVVELSEGLSELGAVH